MSKLVQAKVFHARLASNECSKKNSFTYRSLYTLCDLGYWKAPKQRFLSYNRFNIFSYYDKDHGNKKNENLKPWLDNILNQFNLKPHVNNVELLTMPRVLGYLFSPISLWFCYNNKQLIAVLAEVNNTFKQTHSYMLFNDDFSPIRANQWITSKKEFHVSPFYEVSGEYKFRFNVDNKQVAVWIDYFKDNKKIFATSLIGKFKPINSCNLLKAFIRVPFASLKVIILIHYQALKLLLKGVKPFKKPKQNKNKISR